MIKRVSLRRSFNIQLRVIGALLMREILTRYGRHNIGFLWLFVEPMMFTVGVTALWTVASSMHESRLPITAFALTGYSSVLVWRNTIGRVVGAIQPNSSLMYHRNVKVIDIFISRIILEIVGVGMSFIFLALIFLWINWIDPIEDVSKVIYGWLMLAWFAAALSLLIGAVSERSELIEKIWHPFAYLLMPVSGSAFMIDWLPQRMQEIVLILPMAHGLELIREGFFGSMVHAHYDMGYMAICNLCLTLLGLAMERDISRRVEPE